jgi:hypothetical protein
MVGMMSRLLGRRRFGAQPTQPASVLIVTVGEPVKAPVIAQAVGLSDGDAVAVVALARIYGSAFGLPNPGLLPTRKEMADHKNVVERAIGRLEKAGVAAWGQVAATRHPVKTIVAVAKARGARHVIIISAPAPRWREIIEGNLVKDVNRRMPSDVTVQGAAP